jgi:hypothetical protein
MSQPQPQQRHGPAPSPTPQQPKPKPSIPAVGLLRVPGKGLRAFRALISEDQIEQATEPNLKIIAVAEAKKFMGKIFEVT